MLAIPSLRIVALTALLLCPGFTFADPISPSGEKLKSFIDSLHVEEHWIAGQHVDWRSGDPDGRPVSATGSHTHCSAFVAAACERLGIYVLRPPEHSQIHLASAQYDWLPAEGAARGWKPVPTAAEAQRLANEGSIVVAVYKEPDPARPGHIALIRPSDKSEEKIRAEGPEIAQAGGHNHNDATLQIGFKNHPAALSSDGIRYFAHNYDWTKPGSH